MCVCNLQFAAYLKEQLWQLTHTLAATLLHTHNKNAELVKYNLIIAKCTRHGPALGLRLGHGRQLFRRLNYCPFSVIDVPRCGPAITRK